MHVRAIVSVATVTAALAVGGGVIVAAPPGDQDDDTEELAELAFEKWLVSHGGYVLGTLACGVDSVSSMTVYCYAHTTTGIVAASAPIPAPGGPWAFTLVAGSFGDEGGTPVPTSSPPTAPQPQPLPTAPALPSFGEGMQLVGTDIQPGKSTGCGDWTPVVT